MIGILAALQERQRTGRGGVVDTSLYETTLAWMTLPISAYLANGEIPTRHGSGVEQIVPYQAFETADGFMMVAAGNDNLFRRLCAAIERPGLAEEARFRSNAERVVNRRELVPILTDIFRTAPMAVWAERLDAGRYPEQPDPDPRQGGQRRADRRHSASSSNGREARRCRWSGCRCPSTAPVPPLPRRRPGSARTMPRSSTGLDELAAGAAFLLISVGGGAGLVRPARSATAGRRHAAGVEAREDSSHAVHRVHRPESPARAALSRRPGDEFLLSAQLCRPPDRRDRAPALCHRQLFRRRARLERRPRRRRRSVAVCRHRPMTRSPVMRGCSYVEEFAAKLPESTLRTSRDGLAVTFSSRSGDEKTIVVPAEQITAQLAAIDARRNAGPAHRCVRHNVTMTGSSPERIWIRLPCYERGGGFSALFERRGTRDADPGARRIMPRYHGAREFRLARVQRHGAPPLPASRQGA